MTRVRAYEHQIIDGRMTAAEQVHHRNLQRDDNHPNNLHHITVVEHHEYHRGDWWAEAAQLYTDGMGTYRIARLVHANPTTVYRALVKMGIPLRKQHGGRWHRGDRTHPQTVKVPIT